MHGSLLREGEAHFGRNWHMPEKKSVSDHFLKDGRTIFVGDCALFKPPKESPPFIGIIRGLIYDKEDNLHLHVNWLYRQADLKIGKGISLKSAPNEIFYSFHKDKIPAASLLHPCKVAFLPKGVELPSGTSAFVCRRVYDLESNRLWWLTDQDYANELQEEVDQLLYKTRIEMHGTGPTGGRSPKPINGPTLRPGSDSIQNHSHGKGKKRDRGAQHNDTVKRESSVKLDGGSSCLPRTQSSLRSEIAKITERGGLVDSEGVDKLVHLMQPDKAEKKIDLGYCSMLAGVIAATDKFDCLNRFVQLRGLPVLDEWLQNVHKGKTSNLKDGDKFVEEFLLVLLSALDKLPVNLNALQMCNIGKSVNLLSKHKNLEIQKKAKSLVDTWKKRVEAEFNIMDAKSGSNQSVTWSTKSRLPEASADMAEKSAVTQLSSSKTSLNKLSPGETTKSASSSSAPSKSALSPTSVKDSQPKTIGGSSEVPQTTKENRSSGSSQSHNYCQSRGSRQRKSVSSRGQKDSSKKKLSLLSASEKITHSEKTLDPPALEGSVHKLIVKIPNVRSADGGSVEDHPAIEEKDDQSELKADLVSAALPDEDQTRNAIDVKKVGEVSEASSESSGNKLKPGTSRNGSTCSTFRSMNALIESCVKYSEANTPLSTGDDVGMNLLASVAAGELTKSDLVSPLNSPQRNEEAQTADDARSKPSSGNVEHDLDDKKKVVSLPPGFDRAIKPTAGADCVGEMNKKIDEMKGLASSSPANMEENQGDEEKASTCHGVSKDENNGDVAVELSSSGCLLKDDNKQDEREKHAEDQSMVQVETAGIEPMRNSLEYGDENKPNLECPQDDLRCVEAKAEEKECVSMTEASSSGEGPDTNSKMNFDLNEGFILDDGRCGEQTPMTVQIINPMPVTVAAAAKGSFVPPDDLLRNKRELGWKGSAATSAFRPAEPRKILHVPSADASTSKSGRAPLGFDLNVPDEGIMEEQDQDISHPGRCMGGFELDLNRTDESSDLGICSTSMAPDPRKDFDLNFGPNADDTETEQSSSHQQARGSVNTQPLIAGLRMNGPEMGNYCSWFPPSNSFSTIVPSGAPGRLMGPGGTPFTPDVFRGSVLSSSPAVPFPANPFQIPLYPIGGTFPLPGASFSVGPSSYIDPSTGGRLFPTPSSSQMLAPAEGISSQYPRPYLFSHPDVNSFSTAESKWGRQGLDLNAGLGSMDVEGRAGVLPIASNRISLSSSQSVSEEQAKIYQMGGGGLKRKEFDRGWDNDNFRAKRPS